MNRTAGSYCLFIASMLIFGTIGIFRRFIPLSSAMLAFTRGMLGSAGLLLFTKLRGRSIRHHIGIRKTALLALTGALIGINWILLFEAYNHTTVAIATLCYYMEPTIVILLSPLLLREKLGIRPLVCAAAAVAGMVLVSGAAEGGSSGSGSTSGILLGLGAAVFYASVVILNKKVTIEDAYEKTIIQLFSASVVLIPYLLLTEDLSAVQADSTAVIMTLTVGLVHTGAAYAMYFGSMQDLKAQSAAVLSYIDPVSALLLSAVFLNERLTAAGIAGAVLIIGSALISELGPKK